MGQLPCPVGPPLGCRTQREAEATARVWCRRCPGAHAAHCTPSLLSLCLLVMLKNTDLHSDFPGTDGVDSGASGHKLSTALEVAVGSEPQKGQGSASSGLGVDSGRTVSRQDWSGSMLPWRWGVSSTRTPPRCVHKKSNPVWPRRTAAWASTLVTPDAPDRTEPRSHEKPSHERSERLQTKLGGPAPACRGWPKNRGPSLSPETLESEPE